MSGPLYIVLTLKSWALSCYKKTWYEASLNTYFFVLYVSKKIVSWKKCYNI